MVTIDPSDGISGTVLEDVPDIQPPASNPDVALAIEGCY